MRDPVTHTPTHLTAPHAPPIPQMARKPASEGYIRKHWGTEHESQLDTLIAMAEAVVNTPGTVPAGYAVV